MKNHDSWRDLRDPNSKFVRLLNNVCQYKGQQDVFDIFRLRVLGILWCAGDDEEKLNELYDLVQENVPSIAHNDREFAFAFDVLLEMSVELAIKQESLLDDSERPELLSDDAIEEKKDSYEELFEALIDDLFENESKIKKDEWMYSILQNHIYIIRPNEAR